MNARLGDVRGFWRPAVALVAAATVVALAGTATAVAPMAGLLAAAGLLLLTLALVYTEQFTRCVLVFLGFVLTGYAFLGKGFAYLGAPPLFVGEIALGGSVLAAVLQARASSLVRSPVLALLACYAAWSASRTLPYWNEYGLLALRDAALWAYGIFVVTVAILLARASSIDAAVRAYGRYFWWLPVWMPVYGIVARLAGDASPRAPGTDVPLLYFKPGDAAVHMAGIAIFALLGLGDAGRGDAGPGRDRPTSTWREWGWWGLWLAGMVVAASASRGGLLAAVIAAGVTVLLRHRVAWWRPALVTVVLGGAFMALNIDIDVGLPRKISSRQLVSNVLSIGGSKNAELDLAGTVEWRLAWWERIRGYTVHGPYFWTGKGFGVNLADDDGFQTPDGLNSAPNRNPHSIHYNVLARAGIPGLVLWGALQVGFGAAMLAAYLRARRLGWDWWERVNIWILAYWLALLINASFDVFIEGPQGGIWFWCMIGLGVAALAAQGRETAALASPRPPTPAAPDRFVRRRPASADRASA